MFAVFLPQYRVSCSLRAAGTPRYCFLVLQQKSAQSFQSLGRIMVLNGKL
jgi:hypothetical protein